MTRLAVGVLLVANLAVVAALWHWMGTCNVNTSQVCLGLQPRPWFSLGVLFAVLLLSVGVTLRRSPAALLCAVLLSVGITALFWVPVLA